ncbi:MAG: AI-2E family transporter [Candidatus Colwellbacteria bacterium]|nr:AI-2E family transporter [Candidatus Colwellbacteria bacterium]
MERRVIDVSWGTLWKIFFMLLFVFLVYRATEVLLFLGLALIISSALDEPVLWLERKKIPRILGTTIIFLAGLSVVVLIFSVVFPVLFLELNVLSQSLSNKSATFFGDVATSLREISRAISLSDFSLLNMGRVFDLFSQGAPALMSAGRGIMGGVVGSVSTLIIAFYLTITRDGIGTFLRAIFPHDSEEYIIEIYRRAKRKIGRWFQAQILLSFVIGILVFSGLFALQVPYALALALIAGLFELIPVVGPIFAGALGVLSALTVSLPLALYTFILFVVIQQLENHFLVPVLMRQAVDIHPVLVILSLLIGFEIGGVLGVIIAVPAAVVVKEIIEGRAMRRPA